LKGNQYLGKTKKSGKLIKFRGGRKTRKKYPILGKSIAQVVATEDNVYRVTIKGNGCCCRMGKRSVPRHREGGGT